MDKSKKGHTTKHFMYEKRYLLLYERNQQMWEIIVGSSLLNLCDTYDAATIMHSIV